MSSIGDEEETMSVEKKEAVKVNENDYFINVY